MKLASWFGSRATVSSTSFLIIRSRISDDSLKRIIKRCLFLQRSGIEELQILLSSAGGSARAGFDLYQFLLSMPYAVTTYNMGFVGSIANIVFLSGRRRFAVPGAHFLLHPPTKSFAAHEKLSDADLQRMAEVLKVQQRTFRQTIVRETAMTMEQCDRACEDEHLIGTEEALKLAFIDAVQEPRIPKGATVLRSLDGDV